MKQTLQLYTCLLFSKYCHPNEPGITAKSYNGWNDQEITIHFYIRWEICSYINTPLQEIRNSWLFLMVKYKKAPLLPTKKKDKPYLYREGGGALSLLQWLSLNPRKKATQPTSKNAAEKSACDRKQVRN